MKLRNKVTGEIAEVEGGVFKLKMGVLEQHLQSLERLVDEWEDYEDERQYTISDDGEVVPYAVDYINEGTDKGRKDIGNCFRTKEEAEKAVEKLKAWKRLKDAGFKFVGNGVGLHTLRYSYEGEWCLIVEDFNLLFGGEE